MRLSCQALVNIIIVTESHKAKPFRGLRLFIPNVYAVIKGTKSLKVLLELLIRGLRSDTCKTVSLV